MNKTPADFPPLTLAPSIGALTNPPKIEEARRHDVKGRRYIGGPKKYYFEDIGLRNARLGFRQVEKAHIMENIVYNELRARGYSVGVGTVEKPSRDGESARSWYLTSR